MYVSSLSMSVRGSLMVFCFGSLSSILFHFLSIFCFFDWWGVILVVFILTFSTIILPLLFICFVGCL